MITPYDAPGRYLVPSSDQGADPYLVDLLAHNGEGECTCKDWQCRIGQHYTAHTSPPRTRCRHIDMARDQLASDVIAKLLAQQHPLT